MIRAGLLRLGGSMLEQLLAAGRGYRDRAFPAAGATRLRSKASVASPSTLSSAWLP